VTDLSSSALIKTLNDYQQKQKQVIGREKRRIDHYLSARVKNQQQGRRNSVSKDFSTASFYHYVKVQADHVYLQQTSAPVRSVFRVKTIQETIQFLQGADKGVAKSDTKQELYCYACVTQDSHEVVLLNFSKRTGQVKPEKLPLLSEPVGSVFLDAAT
jgi:hypothetical protein